MLGRQGVLAEYSEEIHIKISTWNNDMDLRWVVRLGGGYSWFRIVSSGRL
jgi:hypothetical protein